LNENGKITSIPFPPELFCAPDRYKTLWLAIRMHCLKGDSCFVGYSRLAKIIGHNERHIRRTMQAMEKDGWVRVTRTPGRPHTLTPLIPRTSTPWVNDLTPDLLTLGNPGPFDPPTPDIHALGSGPHSGTPRTFEVKTPDIHAPLTIREHNTEKNVDVENSPKNKSQKKGDPRIKTLKLKWDETYSKIREAQYMWSSGKDEMALKRMLQQQNPQDLEPIFKRMRLYLEDDFMDWGPRAPLTRSLTQFVSQWNRYDSFFPLSTAKPKTPPKANPQPEPKDTYFDKLCAEFNDLPETKKQAITEKAKEILPKLPSVLRGSKLAGNTMLLSCQIATMCSLYHLDLPETCKSIKIKPPTPTEAQPP
jgi:hypothetical protein